MEVRFIKNGEFDRVRDLIIALQTWQQMAICPRLPTCEDIRMELSHRSASTDSIIPNNLATYIAVAIDNSKEKLGDDSYIVGYILYNHAFTIQCGPHIWLSSFFIEEAYRNRGLGKKFMEFIRLHAKTRGVDRIDVPTMNNNVNGNAFYDRYSAIYVNEEYQMMMKTID